MWRIITINEYSPSLIPYSIARGSRPTGCVWKRTCLPYGKEGLHRWITEGKPAFQDLPFCVSIPGCSCRVFLWGSGNRGKLNKDLFRVRSRLNFCIP